MFATDQQVGNREGRGVKERKGKRRGKEQRENKREGGLPSSQTSHRFGTSYFTVFFSFPRLRDCIYFKLSSKELLSLYSCLCFLDLVRTHHFLLIINQTCK
jgi:hypothetical protein